MPVAMGKRAGDLAPPLGKFGSDENYWVTREKGVDLTRGINENAVDLDVEGDMSPVLIAPSKTALVVVDMQNCFLHPDRFPVSSARDIIPRMMETIVSCRKKGMRIIWLNWGVTDEDIATMPPSYLYLFSNGDPSRSFGSDMGKHFGRKLIRGTWNAETFSPLFELQEEGRKNGTDFYFDKNRLSGLWGAATPMSEFLEKERISTLLFTGVNTEQCVYGTLLDAYHKGYDCILVKDICATPTPSFNTESVVYASGLWGWVMTSDKLLEEEK